MKNTNHCKKFLQFRKILFFIRKAGAAPAWKESLRQKNTPKMWFNFVIINANGLPLVSFILVVTYIFQGDFFFCMTSNVIIVYYRAITARAYTCALVFSKCDWYLVKMAASLVFFCFFFQSFESVFLEIKHVSHAQFACGNSFPCCHSLELE